MYAYILISDDIFCIDEISLYEGESTDNIYVAEGEIIDGVSNTSCDA